MNLHPEAITSLQDSARDGDASLFISLSTI